MAMKRTDGLNIQVLEDKEVLMHFGDAPAIDRKTGAFGPGWHSAGLEPTDSSWTESREVTENTTNLTGGQTATSYTAGAVTGSVDLIAGSPVEDYIEWPETAVKDGTLYRKHSSKVAKAYVARVHKFQSGVVGIKVSREKATLSIPERTTSTDPEARTLNISYKNGDDEFMFEEMFYLVGEDGAVMEVTPKIFQDIEDLQSKIDAGEAFHPSASAAGLRAYVPAADKDEADGVDLVEFTDPETGESVSQPEPPVSRGDAGDPGTSEVPGA